MVGFGTWQGVLWFGWYVGRCSGFMRQIDLLDLLVLVGLGRLCFGVKRCWSVGRRLPGAGG